MGSKGTAVGLGKLRKRYVRRARFLCTDETYRSHIEKHRGVWNARTPEFPIKMTRTGGKLILGPPPALQAAADAEPRLDLDDQDEEAEPSEILSYVGIWWVMAALIAHQFFPYRDFPNPFAASSGSPALPFICASMHTDTRLLDRESLFREFKLMPQRGPNEVASFIDHPVLTDDWTPEAEFIYLPVYPGMTARDLRNSATDIAEYVNDYYKDVTADARTRALRNDGFTYQAIADRLGMHKNTVASILGNGDGTE